MFNLHCHSLLSDGVLLPSELAVRFHAAGYRLIAITDHADYSNIEFVVRSIIKFTENWPKDTGIKVLPGVELTHLPLHQFKPLVKYARESGIKIIIGHGQTLVEPVIEGTNRAAIEAGIDILAHPGLISDEDCQLATEKGVFLEITSRKGHNSTNPHVAEQASKFGTNLILNMDAHTPEDIIHPHELKSIGIKAGLSETKLTEIYGKASEFLGLLI